MGKVSKFFVIAAAVIVLLSIVVLFAVRSILTALNTASAVDEKALESQHERINKANLDKAYTFITEKEVTLLDLR
jgi:hypothetical protein